MNIIEAIKALQAGECEAIESYEGDVYTFGKKKYNSDSLILTTKGSNFQLESSVNVIHISALLAPWTLINPKPQCDEVEVVRWECDKCGYVFDREKNGHCAHPSQNHMAPSDTTFTVLKGTRLVPRKRKVMRRRELQPVGKPPGLEFFTKVGRRYFEEWEEEV